MHIHHKEYNSTLFLVALTAASGLGWFINSYPPKLWWTYGVVYLLVGITIGFLLQFLFARIEKSILGACGSIIFLILRAMDLRNIFYVILLILCLISIDSMIGKIRNKS